MRWCLFISLSVALTALPATTADFLCAGFQGTELAPAPSGGAAKLVSSVHTGTRQVLVVFAQFRGETPNRVVPPVWAETIFDPELPGSFSHFYETMSFGQLQVRGDVAPRVYTSAQEAATYLADDSTQPGQFGRFVREVLKQADQDIDFSRYDNDGPDGLPDSGDDDGLVDAVFLVLAATPTNFLLGGATGVSSLGLSEDFSTDDIGVGGPIGIRSKQGTVQRGRTFAEAVGTMTHEYGHVLGLPDLFDVAFLKRGDAPPAEDSAGIGRWGLMGWGANGWQGNDGPTSFSAWSRWMLGWAQTTTIGADREQMHLPEIGNDGQVYSVPLGPGEFFLFEYRPVGTTYYDRHIPAGGLLIWHIGLDPDTGVQLIDLECADGRWQDGGYPAGTRADADAGGDNLDFWAHETAYTRAHSGNLGDQTDPFDGVRFAAFTPTTNPAARSYDGQRVIRVDDIRIADGVVTAQVQTDPLAARIVTPRVADAGGDGFLSPGEEGAVQLRVINEGGLVARAVRVVLSTDEPLVEIIRPQATFGDIDVGRYSSEPGGGFPRLRLDTAVEGNPVFQVSLELFVDDQLVETQTISVDVVSTYKLSGRVADTQGAGLSRVELILQNSPGLPGSTFIRLRTDDEGYFERDLPPGTYSITVERPNGPAADRQLRLSADRHLEFFLPDLYPVTGVVRNAEGHGLSGVALQVRGGTGFTYANSGGDGHYTLNLPAGIHTLVVSRNFARDGEIYPEQIVGEIVVDGPRQYDLVLQRGAIVRLTAESEVDNGVPALLYVRHPLFLRIFDIGAEGASTLLIPNVYRIHPFSRLPEPYLLPPSPLYFVAGDTTIQVPIARGVQVGGTLHDEGVQPHFSANLLLTPLAGGLAATARIGSDGAWEALLIPGRYEASFVPNGAGSTPAQVLGTIEVDSDRRRFDFTTVAGRPIGGHLASVANLDGLSILAHSLPGAFRSFSPIETDGSFQLSLVPGSYEFFALYEGAYWSLGQRTVIPGEPVELHSPSGATVVGRVLDSAGSPAANALVFLADDPLTLTQAMSMGHHSGGLAAAAITNGDGRFELTVAPGPYALVALPGYGRGLGLVRHITASGQDSIDLSLPESGPAHELYGDILLEEGTPRGQILLWFYNETAGTIYADIDDAPNYHLRLPAGRYQARVGMFSAARGFYRLANPGFIDLDTPQRWDIRLDQTATLVEEGDALPSSWAALEPNYPNPFNPATTISYVLSTPAQVDLVLYNALGQEIRRLVQSLQPAGHFAVQWDGRNAGGQDMASGVYFYRLVAKGGGTDFVQTRKLALIR